MGECAAMKHDDPQRYFEGLTANKEVVQNFLNAIVAGDIETCRALLPPDTTWWVQGWPQMNGADFLAALQQTIERSNQRTIAIDGVTAEDDRVAVQARGAFTMKEGVYANTYHYLFKLKDGRITAGYEYLDTLVASQFFAGA
jgi:uncharacterized protein